MKLHPTAGPKIAHTVFAPWCSLASSSATTPAPHTSPARTTARMRAAVMASDVLAEEADDIVDAL